jgi:nucleoside-diphosphate-sugar epimerase
MPSVLITGATGFIGRALCGLMMARGYHVRGTVRLGKYREDLPTGIETYPVVSISASTDWQGSLKGKDLVVHLAAPAHIREAAIAHQRTSFHDVIVGGTEHLAGIAAAAGVKRFIYISSVKVNGEGKLLPYTERDTPAPLDTYGITKWEAEQALQDISAKTDLEIVIIRPPLVYGPGVKANFLQLMKWAASGIPLPLGSIHNRRSMIYLGNLLDAIMTCAIHPEASGEVFLVSDDYDISVPELIRALTDAMGKKSKLLPFPVGFLKTAGKLTGKANDMDKLTGSLVVDISKIKNLLHWKPPFTFEEGIRETVESFKET